MTRALKLTLQLQDPPGRQKQEVTKDRIEKKLPLSQRATSKEHGPAPLPFLKRKKSDASDKPKCLVIAFLPENYLLEKKPSRSTSAKIKK